MSPNSHLKIILLSTIIFLYSVACNTHVATESERTVVVTPTINVQPSVTLGLPTAPLSAEPTATAIALNPTQTATPRPRPTQTQVVSTFEKPLLAWTISDDGDVYILDATLSVYQLSPNSLTPVAKSSPLFEDTSASSYFGWKLDEGPFNLLASKQYLFIANSDIGQTFVLDRNDFRVITTFEYTGKMALDLDKRVLMISNGIRAFDLADLEKPSSVMLSSKGVIHLDTDLIRRKLYLGSVSIGGSRASGAYTSYDLDTADVSSPDVFSFGFSSGSPPNVARETGLVVATIWGSIGPLSHELVIFNPQTKATHRQYLLGARLATVSPRGDWIYVLRKQDLWVLRGDDLTVQSIYPFTDALPIDLGVSPDGEFLYLVGDDTLLAIEAAQLHNLGFVPVSPYPTCWECSYPRTDLYSSPDLNIDKTAFLMQSYGVTYRTEDYGRSWVPIPHLSFPPMIARQDIETRNHATSLSISPDFLRDETLTAFHTGSGDTVYRSLDKGDTWQPFTPAIAFTSDRDGNREIYTMRQAGTELQRLTNHPAADENPAWSPAWIRIVFQSNRHGNWDIFSMRADCDMTSPDAKSLCDLRQLTNNPADDMRPTWSPDGRFIAFVSTRDGNPEIYVMDKNGQNQRRLTFHPGGDWQPAWYNDNQHLVFTSDRNGNNDIYQLTVPSFTSSTLSTELDLIPLITHPADDRDPVIKPGGKQLLFLSNRDEFNRVYEFEKWGPALKPHLSSPEFEYTTLFTITQGIEPVAHFSLVDYSEVLISAGQGKNSDIYRGDRKDFIPLTDSPAFDGQPAWGPTIWQPDLEASQKWLIEND
ncbi:MAG: hypothetical protein AAF485_01315 [Chloroflexota bacterium]